MIQGYKPATALFQTIVICIVAFGSIGCRGGGTISSPSSASIPLMPPMTASQAMFPQTSTTTTTSGYITAILADSPYQFFELADTSGTVVSDDVSGGSGTYFGSHTLNVTPGPIAGLSKGTLECPGGTTNQCAIMPSASWTAGSSYTLETWVKPVLASHDITVWGWGFAHRLLIEPDGRLLTEFHGLYYSTGVLANDAWSQVDFVYNASAHTASYYINGKLDSTSGVIPAADATMSTYYLGQFNNTTDYKYSGEIADHSTYKKALTPAQILAHYNAAINRGTISMHILTFTYLGWHGGAAAPYSRYAPYLSWSMTDPGNANAISAQGIKVMVYTNPNRETPTAPLYTNDETTFAHSCSGSRIADSDGTTLMNPSSTDLRSLWKSEIDTYEAVGHIDAFEADDADDTYGADATPCGFNATNWLNATSAEDGSVSAPVVYNNLGLYGSDSVSPGIALNATAFGGMMESCYTSAWKTPSTLGDGYWRAIEDTEIQMAAQKKYFFCYAESNAPSGAAAIDTRKYINASFLLTYDPNTSVLFEPYQTTPSHFWVYPESMLVALNPVVSEPSSISSLEVSTNVYAREYSECYLEGSYVGPCAAVVNSDTSSSHSFPFTKYHHTMTLAGGGVLDGGTIATNGPAPSALPPMSGVVAFP